MNTITEDFYDLRIDAYTPNTIPMARLAEYLQQLSNLFGEKERVHFSGLEAGSTRLLCAVECEAAFMVRQNVAGAPLGDESSEPTRAYKQINKMLRENSTDAELYRNGAKVLSFPGNQALLLSKLGPFTQDLIKEGMLVRIGGRDASAHATLEDSDGGTWSFEVTRELARQLAAYLFGNPVRLIGQGRCLRDENGEWQYSGLRASRFEPLDAASLAEVVNGIRRHSAGIWRRDVDMAAFLESLRGVNSENH